MSERKLKPKALREMSPEERRELLNQLRAELVKLQTQRSRGFVEKPGRIRQVRRMIARILTIERELAKAGARAEKGGAKA
ncbi:50S ribosomal protein L29 [Pyrobaculum calidifontis]|uniref:Large ribosomal subunit protein uL29 n=1 Tax=Pyrobaculum calidifontis (strain DSM 21063 / JCM 11548 / VA1) TaxID=410359 RepID=A3MTL2_PYRCJ|nr:50S ribosomal protein L29 [Pyrobaculum calidifontis]ABO07979.1 LSU ribosomal protein L29P [Pyrobaculum calidifontis JCM 11548]